MPLFQNSVLKKYIKTLNPERVGEAYQRYAQHFHNVAIQEDIRSTKREPDLTVSEPYRTNITYLLRLTSL